jgi:hypothetical protein
MSPKQLPVHKFLIPIYSLWKSLIFCWQINHIFSLAFQVLPVHINLDSGGKRKVKASSAATDANTGHMRACILIKKTCHTHVIADQISICNELAQIIFRDTLH